MSDSIGAFARALPAVELLAVLLAAPALLFPSTARLLVALVVPIVWACHWLIGGRIVPHTPLNASLFLLLGMVVVSLGVTVDMAASLGNVSGVILGTLAFWACTRWVNTQDRLRTATLTFIVAGCALAFLGVPDTVWVGKFGTLGIVVARLSGIIHGVPGADQEFHPGAVAGCLLLFVPLQFGLLMATLTRRLPEWRSARFGWLWAPAPQAFLLLLTGGTLLLTGSRSAWVGLLFGLSAFPPSQGKRTRALVVLAIGALIVMAPDRGSERLIDPSAGKPRQRMLVSVPTYVESWSRAIYAIQDFPLTGIGMSTFGKVAPLFYPAIPMSPAVDFDDPHNHLLQVAVDLGVPGLAAYLSIWLTVMALLVGVHRRCDVGAHRALADGLGAGLIARFTFGMTDALPLGAKVGILFWLTLALVVALHQVSLLQAPRRAVPADATT